MEQPQALGPRWDPGIGAFVEDDAVQFSPDPDRPQPPSSPAPQAAPSAPATGRPLDAATLVPALEADARRHEAIAQGHEQRLGALIREGQADVEAVESGYREGRVEGVAPMAHLAARQTERSFAARQSIAEMQKARQERDKNNLWAGAIELGIIPLTAPSTPTPPPAAAPQGDAYADMGDADRNLMGLPVKDEEEAESSQLAIEDARVLGLA